MGFYCEILRNIDRTMIDIFVLPQTLYYHFVLQVICGFSCLASLVLIACFAYEYFIFILYFIIIIILHILL